MKTLSETLRYWRFINKLSQEQVAKKIGITQPFYSIYESGKNRRLPLNVYEKLRKLVVETDYKIDPQLLTIDIQRVRSKSK